MRALCSSPSSVVRGAYVLSALLWDARGLPKSYFSDVHVVFSNKEDALSPFFIPAAPPPQGALLKGVVRVGFSGCL